MRRPLVCLAMLALACALAIELPTGSVASPPAQVAAKKKCKNKKRHHRKRCRKRGVSDGSLGSGGAVGTSGPPGRVLATERELSPSQLQLQLSRSNLAAGSTIVEQYNAGSDPHNLVAERQSEVAFSLPTLDPGGDQRLTVTLKPGTYTLYCSLLDHRELGMQATLTVN